MDLTTVLLAEDELALAHIVRESLEERGFKVTLCPNGQSALTQYNNSKHDILVLDIMMPLMDGFEVARQVRMKDKRTPIIFLTARSQAKDVVTGFELGANDYLKKPFSVEELIVRMQVQLSKTGILNLNSTSDKAFFKFGEFTFQPHKNMLEHRLTINVLTSRESEVLHLLCQNQQQVFDRDELLKKLWGNDSFFNARSLDVFISKLRKYLSADPTVQIINVRGVGYKLVY